MSTPRGKPFEGGGHPRRLRVLHCPWCEIEMQPVIIASLGHRQADDEGLATPYYRYVCRVCGPVEVHRGEAVEGGARG